MQQSLLQNTLQKSAIQRLHVEKCGVQNKRLAVYFGAANEFLPSYPAINWNKERKQFDREHFTIAQIEVLEPHKGTENKLLLWQLRHSFICFRRPCWPSGKAKVLVAQSPTPV